MNIKIDIYNNTWVFTRISISSRYSALILGLQCHIKSEIWYDNTLAQTNLKSLKIVTLQEYQCSVIFQNFNFYAYLDYSLWMALASK